VGVSETPGIEPAYLSPAKASILLDIPEGTLAEMRANGDGPPWHRAGRRLVRYPVDGLHQWMRSNGPTSYPAAVGA
jgi:hypothetical protein